MPEQNRSYLKDFLAGVDPTGTTTFQYGMQDERAGGGSPGRQALHTIGGTLGGAAVMPATIGGVIGGIKGLTIGKGGLKGRLLSAGEGALQGAKRPYTDLYSGIKGHQLLRSIKPGKNLTHEQRQIADALTKRIIPEQMSGIPGAKFTAQQAFKKGLETANPQQLAAARRIVGGEIAAGAGALGLSGLVSGASAHQQYAKGQKAQREATERVKTSTYYTGARKALLRYGVL